METKGITCKIPLELHNRISEEIRASGSTMSKFRGSNFAPVRKGADLSHGIS